MKRVGLSDGGYKRSAQHFPVKISLNFVTLSRSILRAAPSLGGGDPGGEEREQVVDGVGGERQRDRRHLARLLVPAVRFSLNKLYKSGITYCILN